jgi:hypothetical protein
VCLLESERCCANAGATLAGVAPMLLAMEPAMVPCYCRSILTVSMVLFIWANSSITRFCASAGGSHSVW